MRLPLRERWGIWSKATRMLFQGTGGTPGMGWSWGTGSWWDNPLPGSRLRLGEEVGNLWDNSVVNAALNWIGLNAAPARLCVNRKSRAKPEEVRLHPLTRLWERPNPHYSGSRLLKALLLDLDTTGNAFLIKARGEMGRPLELWWAPSYMMQPAWPQDGSDFIRSYVYTVNGQKRSLRVEDVIHIPFGNEPAHQGRTGLSPLRAEVGHIVGDNEGSAYLTAILKNTGVVGAVLSPADAAANLTREDALAIKSDYMARFTGDRRGEPLVFPFPMKLERGASTPKDLELGTILHTFEERICAALQISPQVLSLGAGGPQKTYANYSEARDAAMENCVLPRLQMIADEIHAQLLPDLALQQNDWVGWDLTGIRALQEDDDKLAARMVVLYEGDVIMRSEARARLGYEVDDTRDEVFHSETQMPLALPGEKPALPSLPAPGKNGNGKGLLDRYRHRLDAERAW